MANFCALWAANERGNFAIFQKFPVNTRLTGNCAAETSRVCTACASREMILPRHSASIRLSGRALLCGATHSVTPFRYAWPAPASTPLINYREA